MRLALDHDSEGSDEPNITPLIDIVFILLIFFVVTTTFARDLGLEVERPEASTAEAVASEVLRIGLDAQGRVTVDAEATRSWRVEDRVRQRLRERQDRAVLVVADRSVDAALLVDVIDAARRGGAEQVSLAVEETP